ncbi:glycoside hydrolase family 99-like domain-containing protein [Phocaeicola faecicola]|jgi:hypothetical protein|uniref:glycoside hydrolase family 99-like domain-containing protein n=1 Tax=Phocaeicola faecicola TaxID=2739389 RepID=UPI002A81013D|nr:glycoside hydrolase family 99-like domain-containing protein [Phocaeicola faecicola]MCI5742868.1 glycoside hydrolase family 99-like domain-containing protein [Bacteroides sp.]MDD6909321.1 glycoside hydrolase family 99-like domain-containing protein [Bacteroidaceae bacterium]MDY4872990.1 glycoside hydrolase family 99-like domain-containing protein [Phocaeicola faecicola]
MDKKNVRVLALYLPQFHPIPENDVWWRKGFTEWMNVGKARPLYRGHYQPRVPADLGYYDLRVPEVRKAQADMAREYGVEGFCYWHYWFGNGKQLLERPFEEVLQSGEPDFPFCLAWANESWRGFHHGLKRREILIEQTYPSEEDHIAHFYHVLRAFKDERYVKVDGKPLFMVYQPFQLPDAAHFIQLWQKLARENGLKGIHFVGQIYGPEKADAVSALGFDAVNIVGMYNYKKHRNQVTYLCRKLRKLLFRSPMIEPYREVMKYFIGKEERKEDRYPTIIPNWDHTPRTGRQGLVFHGATPERFERHLQDVAQVVEGKRPEHNLVFIKSWNEWAEGNYMEPDLKYGMAYLEKLKAFVDRLSK